MRNIDLVKFLTSPSVSRGAITSPAHIRKRMLGANNVEVESWKNISSSKTPRAVLTQGEAAALLAKEIVKNKDNLRNFEDINQEILNRALMIAYCLSDVGNNGRNSNTILSRKMMRLYRGILASTLFHNDFIPVFNDGTEEKKYEIDYIHNTIKHVFRESFWFSGKGFERLAYPMKSEGLEGALKQPPLFERFIKKVSTAYTKHWDNDHEKFPGPGIVINGFSTKMFPDGALKTQLWSHPHDNLEPHQAVKRDFKNLAVESEKLLSDSKVGFFRGLTYVSHPKMTVSGRPFTLVIYNEHFQSDYVDEEQEALKLSYLVPNNFIKEFEHNPYIRTLTPSWIDNGKVRKQILDLTCPSVVAGLQRAIASAPNKNEFYPNSQFRNHKGQWYKNDLFGHERSELLEDETRDVNGHMHVTHMDEAYKRKHSDGYWYHNFPLENLKPFKEAHDEIAKATNTGFAILRTVLRGFNNYCYGYDYIPENPKFKLTESTRMLDQSVRWYMSSRKNKPFLVPCTEYGFDKSLVEEIGAVDTNTNFCLKRKGTFELPSEPFADLPDSSKAEIKKAWLNKFLIPAFKNNAFLVQMPSEQAGPLIKDILGARK